MGVAKDFVVGLARDPSYIGLQEALKRGDQNKITEYRDFVSKKVNDFALRVASRMSGYDMVAIAEHGIDSLTPVQKLSIYLMSPTQRRRVEQVNELREALKRQAARYIPVWYSMANLPI